MTISFTVRTNNEERSISKVLEGIFKQDIVHPCEVILVGSGSVDNTVSIAKVFGCSIIRLRPEEFSFGGALNMVENSTGEILVGRSGHTTHLPGVSGVCDLLGGHTVRNRAGNI